MKSYNNYEEEAINRWGSKAKDSIKKIKRDNKEDFISNSINSYIDRFSKLHKENIAFSELKVRSLVEEFHTFLNQEIGNFYTLEVFKNLGEMYVEDVRFKNNIDLKGKGLSKYIKDAICEYVKYKGYHGL